MQDNRTGYQPQAMPYQGTPQFIHPTYPGFNGGPQTAQYNRKVAIVIGNIQMVIGITCVAMNSVLISLQPTIISFISYGIWGGMLFIVAGLAQVLSGNKIPNKCMIIAAMVLCILAACVSPVVITFGVIDAVTSGVTTCNNKSCYYRVNEYALTYLSLGSVMAILAFIEAVISIIGSAYCCSAVCCSSSNVTPVPVYFIASQPFVNQGNNAEFVLPQHQNPFQGQLSANQMARILQPQAPSNPGLASYPPPSYAGNRMPETKSS